MSDTVQSVKYWKEQGAALAKALRKRLAELDKERREVIDALTHIEGKAPHPDGLAHSGGRGNFSVVTQTVFNILREAGPVGMSAKDLRIEASEELAYPVRREIVATQLSRYKRLGKLRSFGPRGHLRYAYIGEPDAIPEDTE